MIPESLIEYAQNVIKFGMHDKYENDRSIQHAEELISKYNKELEGFKKRDTQIKEEMEQFKIWMKENGIEIPESEIKSPNDEIPLS